MNNQKQMTYQVEPIAFVKSPFKEKFGLPRQPGLIHSVDATIEFLPKFSHEEAFRELESFSHIWLTFIFHKSLSSGWKPCVRPPRLGGNQKVGVFSSRSPFRPNFIGSSVVELKSIRKTDRMILDISCPDLIDQTPILDIKPYITYSDSLPFAKSGFAEIKPAPSLRIIYDARARDTIHARQSKQPHLQTLIEETLALDPRPAYKKEQDSREYGLRLYDLNIRFKVDKDTVTVLAIENLMEG